ncbi:acetyl-lysine deacetylase [Halolamina pelagica]|uniref:Acetyl-lysine deacetylase n=1 Tax=Halolamina pelagica TaxID=699431 RepID=A0A0N8I038_9EURY|nr:M20/M25/M40 family metallo-hydrolase [Halolamina pelagica]KPN31227.1 acetyl-lysine deacetylase [Halolamina pelagica]
MPGEISVRVETGDADLGVPGPVLWGRGSVDATGALAAMVVAAVETGASFVGVVGEETDSRGARYLVEERDAPETVINGEPSGWDAVTLGYRGIVGGEYTATTPASHGARPEANAIDRATAWWERVRGAVDDANADAESGGFDTVTATAEAIEGGLSADGAAVTASMTVRFRVPPSETPISVRSLVDDCCRTGTVSWGQSIPAHVASPRGTLPAAVRGRSATPAASRLTSTRPAPPTRTSTPTRGGCRWSRTAPATPRSTTRRMNACRSPRSTVP